MVERDNPLFLLEDKRFEDVRPQLNNGVDRNGVDCVSVRTEVRARVGDDRSNGTRSRKGGGLEPKG